MTEEIRVLLERISDSVNAAQAHYQIWFTLRGEGKALPEYYDDMNDYRYRAFFYASNSGHYKLMFIELGCLFDSDERAASIRNLKIQLTQAGRIDLVQKIDDELDGFSELVKKIVTVRSRLIAHKDIDASPKDVYSKNGGITPDQIGELISNSSSLINFLYSEIFDKDQLLACETDRFEKATFSLLKVLKEGRSSKNKGFEKFLIFF